MEEKLFGNGWRALVELSGTIVIFHSRKTRKGLTILHRLRAIRVSKPFKNRSHLNAKITPSSGGGIDAPTPGIASLRQSVYPPAAGRERREDSITSSQQIAKWYSVNWSSSNVLSIKVGSSIILKSLQERISVSRRFKKSNFFLAIFNYENLITIDWEGRAIVAVHIKAGKM